MIIKGGGGGGVQAYNFGNFNFEIRVEGEGQDTSRLFLGWSWVHARNFNHVRPRSKNGAKHQNLNKKRWSFDFDTIRVVSKNQAI